MRALIPALLFACGGGGGSTDVTTIPDADPNAPLCTGAAFDNCTANEDCASLNCHLFRQSAFQVCTQACDASNPCPNDATGVPGTCNNMGICKPVAANACRPN
jgi:hypothetical protein